MKKKWLEQGYRDFAKDGPDKLSINQLAKKVGASRSSFYHYFAEIDVFVDELLALHWTICLEFNSAGQKTCKKLIPDLYHLLSQHPVPLQFSRQLFLNRHIPRYNYLFVKTYELSSKTFVLDLFAEHLELQQPHSELNHLFLTLGEAWYSRLDPQDLSEGTIQHHAEDILRDLLNFIDTGVYSKLLKVPQ